MPEETVTAQAAPQAQVSTPQPAPVGGKGVSKKSNSKLPLIAIAIVAVVAIIGVGAYLMLAKTAKPVVKRAATVPTSKEATVDPNTIVVWSWNTAASALQELIFPL